MEHDTRHSLFTWWIIRVGHYNLGHRWIQIIPPYDNGDFLSDMDSLIHRVLLRRMEKT